MFPQHIYFRLVTVIADQHTSVKLKVIICHGSSIVWLNMNKILFVPNIGLQWLLMSFVAVVHEDTYMRTNTAR